MLKYSNEQLATIIGVPIVTILLLWTVAIFHKNRKKWNSYDIAIVAVLVQSVLRNLAILGYTTLLIAKTNGISTDYCRGVVWIFNSLHTFQASSLTTLAVIALFTAKLYRKQQNLQQYLTPTHVIYHLFCLTTLCACVGVAAILAQEHPQELKFQRFDLLENKTCKFMPYELDVKFNIFIIVLHIFLAMVSFTSFIFICVNHMKIRRQGFDYLKKSISDLSELSLSLTASVNQNEMKNYYDTYTIQRHSDMDGCDGQHHNHQNHHGFCNREPMWNSDLSNFSMTVSSTNSKRPCLNKQHQEEPETETGLHTMYPVLAVCYLFNHLPLIVLCIFPRLVLPWPVSGVALWMGQLQDVLIPIGLGIVDSRFCKWVSKVYKCTDRRKTVDKVPPGVGLDGKFRPFSSQPQSLEINQTHVERPRGYSPTEPKFPITNGSLYTSIDGRLPIIHNYRRHKDPRSYPKTTPHSINMNLHSTHLKRQDYVRSKPDIFSKNSIEKALHPCIKCESNYNLRNFPSNNLMVPQVLRNPSFNVTSFDNPRLREMRNLQKRISLSQDSLCRINLENLPVRKPEARQKLARNRRRVGMNNRMSKSEDCLNDLQKDLQKFKQNPEVFQIKAKDTRRVNTSRQDLSCISSDDEYFTDSVNLNETGVDFDQTSQSSYSITTEANCDFDFFQSKDYDQNECRPHSQISPERTFNEKHFSMQHQNVYSPHDRRRVEMTTFKQTEKPLTPAGFTEAILARSNSRCSKTSSQDLNFGRNFRITRSNSKRSLENFQAYVDEEVRPFGGYKIQRSNSFMTIEDRKKCNRKKNSYSGNSSHNMNISVAYLEDVYNHNVQHRKKIPYHGGSVPDFKKVFISEYI